MSGFIIRNDEGFIMGSRFQGHNLVYSDVIAEALAALHGLQFALDLGFTNVILESDSRLVFKNIQQLNEDYSETRPFTWDAKNLARKFHFCRFQFIAREGNGAAHAMAAEDSGRFYRLFFWETIKRYIKQILAAISQHGNGEITKLPSLSQNEEICPESESRTLLSSSSDSTMSKGGSANE
ncbi:hypothetical protein J1N35_005158 [Gossypium stocksii]|uniref:RNase H type-1 domain-containing protein n=1 Tax=Gossypium stocksii TaxID=47602 RepID=A0A9D4AIQ8_9ROSI|nr:hypothetical protein J1N35_005158 [Gossypium stocksii]